MIDNDEIVDLIENANECEYLDFKLEEYQSYNYHELIKDIMAFANAHTKQSKYIIVGLKKKDGQTIFNSLSSITDDSNYQVVINEYIEPSLTFKYIPFDYQDNQLGVFVIDSSNYENRLFQIKKDYKRGKDVLFKKGESRIRKGSSTSTLNPHDFKKIYTFDERKSNLIIQAYKNDEIISDLSAYNFDDLFSNIVNNKKRMIEKLINKIESIAIVKVEDMKNNESLENCDKPFSSILNAPIFSEIAEIGKVFKDKFIEDVKIDSNKIEKISLFCEKNNLNLSNVFFDVGSLKLYEKFGFGNGMPYQSRFVKGSFEEEQKYDLINELYEEIRSYVWTSNYLENIKGLSYLKLIISNIGNLKDDNITVSLTIPKNCLCKKEQLKCSNEYGSALFSGLYKKHLQMKDTPDIETYHKSVLNGISSVPTTFNPLLNCDIFGYERQSSEEAKKQEIIYETKDILDEIYCYDYVDGKDYDVIKFELNKLMHNSKCFFPEVIVFKSLPSEIKYEIKSTELKEIVTGILKIPE